MREILPQVLALRFPELYFCLYFHVSLLLPTSVGLISVKNTKKKIFQNMLNMQALRSMAHYRPQRSCEGYVFTGVCLFTGGEGCLPQYMVGYTLPPSEQIPPEQNSPPRVDITPGADTPREQTPHQEQTPPERRPLLRTVCILLECILVLILHIWSVPNWDKVRDHTQTWLICNTNLFGIFFRFISPHPQNIETEHEHLGSSRIPQVGHCCPFQTQFTQSQTLHVSGCYTVSHSH